MNTNKKICFIGSGNMAEALIKGVIDHKICLPDNIVCFDIDKKRLDYLQQIYSVQKCLNDNGFIEEESEILLKDSEIFVLSIKPDQASDVLNILKKYIDPSKLIISIMAGIKIEKIENIIASNKQFQIVRAMPNTPALIGEGAIGYSCNGFVNISNKDFISHIFSAIGIALEVSESDLDAVTALSGSGPAYVFYLAEALIEAGVNMGLNEEVSKILIYQTLLGSSKMLRNSKEAAVSLRKKVTSKGGTTQAACTYFDEKKLKDIVKNALKAAKERSIEISEI